MKFIIRWMTCDDKDPKCIKEETKTYNWPEDWEDFMWPDENNCTPDEYVTVATMFYNETMTLVHFIKRIKK